MDISDFKPLEVKRVSPLKANFNGKQLKRTLTFMIVGALASAAWFYYTNGQHMDVIAGADWFKSAAIGSLFGLFISNSPCARGKC